MMVINRVLLGLVLLTFLWGCEMEAPEGMLRVGAVAPSVQTRTLRDVEGDMSRLTTYRYPDERMYQYSIDEALATGKTVLVEFATPGHCTVCDKQLQMLKAMITKYGDDVVFLHMDQYKNPQAFIAFKVKGDPWTFIVDKEGVVQFKQAGRILYGELDHHLGSIVGSKGKNG